MFFGLGRLGIVGGKRAAPGVPGVLAAGAASFTLTGQDAYLRVTRAALLAGVGSFALTGIDATFTYNAVVPGTPSIVWTSDTATTPPAFSFTAPTDADLVVGDVVRFQRSTASDFLSSLTEYTNTVDSAEDLANALTFSSGTWADGTWYVRARTERGATNSAWSNTETKTLAAGGGAAVTLDAAHKLNATLSNGDLTIVNTSASPAFGNSRSTTSHSGGKYYVEVTIDADDGASAIGVGLVDSTFTYPSNSGVGITTNSAAYYDGGGAGTVYVNAVTQSVGPGAFTTGDIIRMAVDLDNQRLWWSRRRSAANAAWNGDVSADPETNTNGLDISALTGAIFVAVEVETNGEQVTMNFLAATTGAAAAPVGFGNW